MSSIEATAGGVADAVALEVVDLTAGRRLAVVERADVVEDRDVDRLSIEVRMCGCCSSGAGEVLVGVDADGPLALAGLGGRVEDAEAGLAGGVVDDVGAALVHAVGRGLALGRVRRSPLKSAWVEVLRRRP